MPIKVIARVMECSKNTVKRALAGDGPPRYERAARGSIVGEVEPRIRELLAAWLTMPATVVAERIGWTRSSTVLTERVRELRPAYLPPDLTGLARVKFDVPGQRPQRFRLVYRQLDGTTREIIAIGPREQHAIYRLAASRLSP